MQRSASPWLDLEREFVQTVGFVCGVPNFLATDKEPNEGPRERFSCFGRCGRTVAGQTWAFNMSFAHAQNVITGANIALLVKTRGGWSLYGGLSGSPPWR